MTPAFAAHVLARYRARQIIAEQYRWAGRKLASVGVRQWHADAERYLAEHPELIESCAQELPSLD